MVSARLLSGASFAIWALVAAPGCSFSRAGEEQLFPDGGKGAGTGTDMTPPPSSDAGKVSSDAAQTCVVATPQTTSLPPDVLIVLDRSGSMNDTIDGVTCRGGCGAQSKWAQMTGALEAFVPTVQANVNWGLKLFASPASNTCGVSSSVEVLPAANNAAAITRVIAGATAGSSTPTTAAETAAASYLKSLNDGFPKYILLATDGIPNCGSSPCAPGVDNGGVPNSCDDANAIAAVQSTHDTLGIPTFVIG